MIRPMAIAAEAADISLRSRRADTFKQIAHSMLLAEKHLGAKNAAEHMGYDSAASILKASVGGSKIGELPQYAAAATAWAGSIKNSAFDFATRFMRQVPRRTPVSVMTAVGSSESEGLAKNVSKLDISIGDMTSAKGVALVVVSNQLLEAEDFDLDMVSDEMAAAVRVAVDTPFVAALEAGVSPITTGASFEADMRSLLTSVPRGSSSRMIFIGSSDVSVDASLQPEVQRHDQRLPIAGGAATLLGLSYVQSDALAEGELLLVDCAQIAYWADPLIVDIAQHASLEMVDAGTQSSLSPPVSSEMVSLWQTNSSGIKAERRFAVRKLTSNCVAKLSGVGQGSPLVSW